MNSFRFDHPWVLLLIIAVVLIWFFPKRRGGATFGPYQLAQLCLKPSKGPIVYRLLMSAALICMIAALARPQYGRTVNERQNEGRDLLLAIDFSGSMSYEDMPSDKNEYDDRLAAVIDAAKEFINSRVNDRIGLIFFAEQAFLSCPLTYDHETVIRFLDEQERMQRAIWKVDDRRRGLYGSGTAIGLGLGRAIERLNEVEKENPDHTILGKAIILITDGDESVNTIDPKESAKYAKRADTKVYTIGVGNPQASFVRRNIFGQQTRVRYPQPNMGLLHHIANTTGGVAAHAKNPEELSELFEKISELEPSPYVILEREEYSDRFQLPLILSLIFAILGLVAEPRLRGPL